MDGLCEAPPAGWPVARSDALATGPGVPPKRSVRWHVGLIERHGIRPLVYGSHECDGAGWRVQRVAPEAKFVQ